MEMCLHSPIRFHNIIVDQAQDQRYPLHRVWHPHVDILRWHRKFTDISQQHIASIFRVEDMLNNQAALHVCLVYLRPWRWRQYVVPKRLWACAWLHGVTSQVRKLSKCDTYTCVEQHIGCYFQHCFVALKSQFAAYLNASKRNRNESRFYGLHTRNQWSWEWATCIWVVCYHQRKSILQILVHNLCSENGFSCYHCF
jgi:hypothetical protein